MNPGVGIIVLSRFSSSRLPGKALKEIGGKPLLANIIDRLQAGLPKVPIVIATSDQQSDDPIAALAKTLPVRCYRGSLDNVALRFLEAAEENKFTFAIRITGDSLFIDTKIVADLLEATTGKDFLLASNRKNQTFPIGQSVEVVNVKKYKAAYSGFQTAGDFEHVTEFFHRNRDLYSRDIYDIQNQDGVHREVSMAIDSPEDFERACYVVDKLGERLPVANYKEVYKLMVDYPKRGT